MDNFDIQDSLNKTLKPLWGNCTHKQCYLMSLGGLFCFNDLVGGLVSPLTKPHPAPGARHNRSSLLSKWNLHYDQVVKELENPTSAILDIERKVTNFTRSGTMPNRRAIWCSHWQVIIPWIDKQLENGQRNREEWKGQARNQQDLKHQFKYHSCGWPLCSYRCITLSCNEAFTLKIEKRFTS